MTRIKVDDKTAFQTGINRRLKAKSEDPIKDFAKHFFADLSISDINEREWEDVLASLRSSWKFYKGFRGNKAQIRIVPGAGNLLVIEIASINLPFLLDSVRLELKRLDLVLADVQQCLMGVVRSSRKVFISDAVEINESLIRLEIESSGAPENLEDYIAEVIEIVRQVVEDFSPMRKQLLLWSDDSTFRINQEETYELLRWFYANNFTFLGYEEHKADKNGKLRMLPRSRMGLSRPGMSADAMPITEPDGVLNIEKLPIKSRVHRPAYLDSITICERKGKKIARICRFVGLFTSTVYNANPVKIPLVRQKIANIFSESDVIPSSHKGREISRIIEVLPREELFFASGEDLKLLVTKTYAMQERRLVRVLLRQDNYFANCIIHVPKDTYDTELRIQIQDELESTFDTAESEFSTYFSESALIRIHFTLRISSPKKVDMDNLEQKVLQLTRSWTDDLQQILFAQHEPSEAERLLKTYRNVFSPGYRADFSIGSAYGDLHYIEQLSQDYPLALKFYEVEEAGELSTRFKLFHWGGALPLSDVIPILENLGAKTIEEHPYELCRQGEEVWIHDFLLELNPTSSGGFAQLQSIFEEAFSEIWRYGKENDSFNRLVTSAAMNIREVSLIRTYSRYFGQLQSGSSQQFIADCVSRYSTITTKLFDLFERRFNPASLDSEAKYRLAYQKILDQVAEEVVNLGDDRVLRGFVELILATQRTNYFQMDCDGQPKDYVALKFLPGQISEMPEPKPAYEIFIYSPRVEGVHLRGGKIARGGLRWSDRTEDYRTEVLGLVKAQQVKNSIIVPVGAKGGFLPKWLPENGSRDEIMAEGIICYKVFIQGLLDLTDNLVLGEVVKPKDVVCYDDDDYYLVVAADKGTATFSDIANELAESNGFWLGDAFASGGSIGYDHKAMGITAKGAWMSVQQHFRDMSKNIQENDFSVVGIGDMSGDVFGNGMLLSEHICLTAAFNHMHIFVDPNPNSKRSFQERERLFNLPRSSWTDYNEKLISKGGGIFSRSSKTIKISKEMQSRFDIEEAVLSPSELMNYILKADVDLLWNGGIGTYVKSRAESDLDVSDKANDNIRINANELRCKVIGEGGNLGITQLARIEYCLNKGVCFTDFIDNAGGVNCSDIEVNIKILLNQLLESGELSSKARNSLLRQMTPAVSKLVLDNNYRQAQAINLMNYQSKRRGQEYAQLMRSLEDQGKLNRRLEFLPNEEELQDRSVRGESLTAPELAILASYVKGILKQDLTNTDLVEDEYIAREMCDAFPQVLTKKYKSALFEHRLKSELVGTQLANGMIDYIGMIFVTRMKESTGATTAAVAKSYIVARDVFALEDRWREISDLDYKIDHKIQKEMMMDLRRLVRRITRWLLRNRRRGLDLQAEIPVFQDAFGRLFGQWQDLLKGKELERWKRKTKYFQDAGVPTSLAGFIAATHHLYAVMGIVEACVRTSQSVERIAEVYFSLGESLELNWFSMQIHEYQADTQWQALARESLQDDLNWQQVALTLGVVNESSKSKSIDTMIQNWTEKHEEQVKRWLALHGEMKASIVLDPAVFTVGIRELLDLAQSSSGAGKRF
ncbi:MAG: glutamate dehydrogenase [Candidatus Azotimanducaceae bacterium]|jgi:glutamate dehydrogenase